MMTTTNDYDDDEGDDEDEDEVDDTDWIGDERKDGDRLNDVHTLMQIQAPDVKRKPSLSNQREYG